MLNANQQAICEAFSILTCDNGWTACRIKSLVKTIEQDMAPYRQGDLVGGDGKVIKDEFLSALKSLIKECYVTKREINGVEHFTLDKEAFYPG